MNVVFRMVKQSRINTIKEWFDWSALKQLRNLNRSPNKPWIVFWTATLVVTVAGFVVHTALVVDNYLDVRLYLKSLLPWLMF